MSKKSLFNSPIANYEQFGEKLFSKSLVVLTQSQLSTGGTTASLPGTRYAGHVYPRDHGYATRAFIAAQEIEKAQRALTYILTCELTKDGIMYQRYDENGKNASYKPPQIDGNAQTLLSLAVFCEKTNDMSLCKRSQGQIKKLLDGIKSQIEHFKKGSLVFSINGIIEYAVFEQGYDLYTNAACYRALKNIAKLYEKQQLSEAKELDYLAEKIKNGITQYLYYPSLKTFIPCLRREPDVSYVLLANLKSFLALADFDVFEIKNPKMQTSLAYHLENTQNMDLGGYNRYNYFMDRHNFGNGPWPMVMLRLAQYYIKANEKSKAEVCFRWVMNAAKHNLDQPNTLPEHISTKESFVEEYEAFKRINETAPRPAKEKEYMTIQKSKTFKESGLAYAVNPLTWSHSQFILAWKNQF